MIPINFIWILDSSCLVPALLSTASFPKMDKTRLKVIFCGEINEEIRMAFAAVKGNLELIGAEGFQEEIIAEDRLTIWNRQLRMQWADSSQNEWNVLVDADLLFSDKVNQLVDELRAQVAIHPHRTIVTGVKEYNTINEAWLYFKRSGLPKPFKKVPTGVKKACFKKILGVSFQEAKAIPQFNNGLIAFYNASEVVAEWRRLYLSGLKSEFVNPADDQVPLAVAMYHSREVTIELPNVYNSLGQHDGDYIGWHVWNGRWKNEILAIHKNQIALSRFGQQAQKKWGLIPIDWLIQLEAEAELTPHFFRYFHPEDGCSALFQKTIERGGFSNVLLDAIGTGRSLCFVLEWLQINKVDAQVSILARDESEDIDEVLELLHQLGFTNYQWVKEEGLTSSKYDCLVLNAYSSINHLEKFYALLKEKGVVVGIDVSSTESLAFEESSISSRFSSVRNLTYRSEKSDFYCVKPSYHIPLAFHFIWFEQEQGSKPFSYIHYLSLLSAIKLHPEATFNLYTNTDLEASQWVQILENRISLIKVTPPEEIYGQPLNKVEHKSDVFRLNTLIEQGGIYLDLDVICIRPFYELFHSKMAMGAEKHGGLCNAVIIAEKNAPFLIEWKEAYHPARHTEEHYFDPNGWGEMSLSYPKKLSYDYQEYIRILPPTAFYDPIGTKRELRMLFDSTDDLTTDRFALHLWESQSWNTYLKDLSPKDIETKQGYFYQLMRSLFTKDEWYGVPTNTLEYAPV